MSLEKNIDPGKISLRILEGQPDHDVIYSAARGHDGRIYLGLSGETWLPGCFAKLVRYDPAADSFEDLADLGKVIRHERDGLRHPHSKIHTAICIDTAGRVLLTTHMTAPPVGEDSYHYWNVYNDPARCFSGSRLIIHDPRTGSTEDAGLVLPRCGVRWMTYNPEREELYVTSFLDSRFHVIRLKTGEVRDIGRISHYDFMGPCWCADGFVYTSDHRGNFLRYDPVREEIERLPLVLPRAPWSLDDHVGVFALVPGPGHRKLYGVAYRSQRLFEFDPAVGRYGRIRDLGTLGGGEDHPARYPEGRFFPRTMSVGGDGLVYAAGRRAGDRRVFTLDPESGEVTDHGSIRHEGFPDFFGFFCSCMGEDDTFYFTGGKMKNAQQEGLLVLFSFHRERIARPVPPGYSERFRGLTGAVEGSGETTSYHLHSRNLNAVFVSRGTFYAQDQGEEGYTPLIPRGESATTALYQDGPSGAVLGATTGARNHLFAFLPIVKKFLPLAVFGAPGTGTRAFAAVGDKLYFGTFSPGGKVPGALYGYDLAARRRRFSALETTDRGEFYGTPGRSGGIEPTVEEHGEIIPGEGIRTLVSDGRNLYGISYPGGRFFTWEPGSGKARVFDIFDRFIMLRANIPGAMVRLGESIFFSGHHGMLIRYDISGGSFEEVPARIPCGAGREYLNTLSAAVADGEDAFYGGTSSDGLLFRFEAGAMKLTCLGKPASEGRTRALVLNHDGVLWGIAGHDWELSHLFRYEPAGAGMEDLGIIRAKIPRTWVAHRADAMIRGLDGELYVGEHDDISHLLIYYPPVAGCR